MWLPPQVTARAADAEQRKWRRTSAVSGRGQASFSPSEGEYASDAVLTEPVCVLRWSARSLRRRATRCEGVFVNTKGDAMDHKNKFAAETVLQLQRFMLAVVVTPVCYDVHRRVSIFLQQTCRATPSSSA